MQTACPQLHIVQRTPSSGSFRRSSRAAAILRSSRRWPLRWSGTYATRELADAQLQLSHRGWTDKAFDLNRNLASGFFCRQRCFFGGEVDGEVMVAIGKPERISRNRPPLRLGRSNHRVVVTVTCRHMLVPFRTQMVTEDRDVKRRIRISQALFKLDMRLHRPAHPSMVRAATANSAAAVRTWFHAAQVALCLVFGPPGGRGVGYGACAPGGVVL
jgi:hypothetical protein